MKVVVLPESFGGWSLKRPLATLHAVPFPFGGIGLTIAIWWVTWLTELALQIFFVLIVEDIDTRDYSSIWFGCVFTCLALFSVLFGLPVQLCKCMLVNLQDYWISTS